MPKTNSQDWKALLKGAFAGQAAPFAVHPCDGERARKMFHAAMNAGVGMPEILAEASVFLKSQGCNDHFIENELIRIEDYRQNPMRKLKSKRAWLITWEDTNQATHVAAILNYRKSARTVSEFLENLYMASEYSLAEKLTYARGRKDNPYPAEFDKINGASWEGRITCGHDPFLYARLVTKLAVCGNSAGDESLVWEEIEKPEID